MVLLCCTSYQSYSEEPKTTEIYNSGTNYSDDFSVSIGVQQALSQQGIILNGIDYGFDYRIGSDPTEGRCFNWFLGWCTDWRQVVTQDTHISGGTKITDADGNVVVNQNQYWSSTTGWTSYSNTLTIPDDGLPYKEIGTLHFDYVLHDDVNLSNIWADAVWIYDPCYLDPLSSVTCPGYAAAYAAQQLEEMTTQQTEEPIIEVTPTQTSSQSTAGNQPSAATGGNPEPTQEVAVQETVDTREDKKDSKSNLALARSLDAANNFDVSSVSGAPTADAGLDVAAAAEQQVIGGSLDASMDQTISGLGGLPSNNTTSEQNQQTSQTREERQERREKLKELTESRANEIAEENAEAESMDEQAQQQMEQLALMNFVPGFDTYGISLNGGVYPDVAFYKPTTVPESKRGLRNGLAQQLLHEQMIEMQYRREQ